MKLVEEMVFQHVIVTKNLDQALLECNGYSHFLRLFDLVMFISQSAIANMQDEMFEYKESREYCSLFKVNWILK